MVKRIQVKPRMKHPPTEAETDTGIPPSAPTPSPPLDSGLKIKVTRKQKPLDLPSAGPVSHPPVGGGPADSVDIDPDWADQAERLASELTGPAPSSAVTEPATLPGPHPRQSRKPAATPPSAEPALEGPKPGSLRLKKKETLEPVVKKKKRGPLVALSLPEFQFNLAAASVLFLAGNVLLAFSMFGFGSPLEQFNSVSLIGICVAETMFIISTFHSGEAFATFSRTLIGAFTLFSALTAVGVFMAEAFLVPSLGFQLVRDMPSAPLTASATFVFSACLVLNTRAGKTKWPVVLMCLLAAATIPWLPVQRFVADHIDEFTLDRFQHLF
ncbi:MAG: hypothetical protein RRC34_14550 [Lentisphaeria bacterium]|nr:hypothetical protein [Lentisphaeria bacterium]